MSPSYRDLTDHSMRFADPFFLFALLLIGIPILIHFLQFKRYKTVYFSQVNFLKILIDETQKKNKLKQLLILLSRIMATALLVLAFARPYIPLQPGARVSSVNTVGIYIDNSFSMNGNTESGSLIEVARQKAIDLANSFQPGTNFFLLTNDPDNKHLLSLSREQFTNEVARIGISPARLRYSQAVSVLNRRQEAQFPRAGHSVYILGDFQANQADLDRMHTGELSSVFALPLSPVPTNNLRVDTAWLENPGRLQAQTEVMTLRISNQSKQSYHHVPVRLFVNDSLKAIQPVNLGPGEQIETSLTYRNLKEGFHFGKVEIDDYPIVFDNNLFVAYQVEKEVRALAVYNETEDAFRWLSKLFADDKQVTLTGMPANRLQLNQLAAYQCIYLLNLDNPGESLREALVHFCENGGSLVVFPGSDADLNSYNSLFGSLRGLRMVRKENAPKKMDQLNLNHPVFRDVFSRQYDRPSLPQISLSFRLERPDRELSTDLITCSDGTPALCEVPVESGRLYQFCFSLTAGASDFYRHALFVPVVYNLALHSYFPQTIQYAIEPGQTIVVKTNDAIDSEQLRLKNRQDGSEMQLPATAANGNQIRFATTELVHQAGFYDLHSGNKVVRALAFNYNRAESDTSFLKVEQLKLAAAEGGNHFSVVETSTANWLDSMHDARSVAGLWKFFAAAALLFVLTELLIIRFWK